MQNDDRENKIGFIGALFGLAIQPWESTQLLLQDEKPRFAISFLVLFILIIFGPALIYILQHGDQTPVPQKINMLAVAFLTFLILYIIFQAIFFFILGFEFTFAQLFASIIYSLTPFMALLLIVYAFNYISSGNFRFLHAMAQGQISAPLAYTKIMPWLVMITELSMFFTIMFSIKVLNDASNTSAFIYTFLALAPLAAAAYGSGIISEIFVPGSKSYVFKLNEYLGTIWQFAKQGSQ